MNYIVKYTEQIVLNKLIICIESNWSLNVRFLIKSACPNPHFHKLFMLKLYDEIRWGYKKKMYFKIIKAESCLFMRICIFFNKNQVIGFKSMSIEFLHFGRNGYICKLFVNKHKLLNLVSISIEKENYIYWLYGP